MTRWLTLSRAAHLSGMTRGALQKKVRDGELASYDGLVSTEALGRAFPGAELEQHFEDAGAFERVERIKMEAFGRRVRERVLPSQELLTQRLFAQGQELAELRRHLARYHQLVTGVQEQLAALLQQDSHPALAQVAALLDAGLAEVLGSQTPVDPYALMDDMLRMISARVTLRPSNREFLVEGNDTLLEAALKAGAAPSYGCGNGNCGLCKARVVSGEVRRLRPSDYLLSEAEHQQGCVLMCVHTAVTDVVLEALEARSAADIPEQSLVATVKAVRPLDADTLLLHLQTPRSNRLRFLAGQGATLGVAGGSTDFSADYAIASCPCDERNLHFHVRRDDNDAFAARLFLGALKPGDAVNVRGPWGDCVIEEDDGRPLVFIAAGHGFAPVAGLIEHALAAGASESITLLWTAPPGGHYLANQGRAWAAALDDFRYLQLDAGADEAAAAAVMAALAEAGVAPERSTLRAAGPAAFTAALAQRLAAPDIRYFAV